jgi:hypothetical protein
MDDDPFGIFGLFLCSYFYDRGNTRDHLRDAENEAPVENFFRTSHRNPSPNVAAKTFRRYRTPVGFAGFAGVLR